MAHNALARAAGILLHPSSLYTPYGIGDLGPAAVEFLNFLEKARHHFWQILPLGPVGYGNSPYASTSAFAGNPLLISPQKLQEWTLLREEDLGELAPQAPHAQTTGDGILQVNFDAVRVWKGKVLARAFKRYKANSTGIWDKMDKAVPSIEDFSAKQADWLKDFTLYEVLRQEHGGQPWNDWPRVYRDRDEGALGEFRDKHKGAIEFQEFIQWIFACQWESLRNCARENDIQIIGDMPLFVALDSADVWAHPEYFSLNPDGTLEYQAGVPPDYFSESGQLWGVPVYRWDKLESEGFSWFLQRIHRLFEQVDWVRIDHFRGLEAYWRVQGDAKVARKGKWVKGPGKALFRKVREKFGELPFIAEDLGVITPEVEELRDEFHFPGMRVIQFAFFGDATNPHLPHNYLHNCVAYTGTHDNNTTKGWWDHETSGEMRGKVYDYLAQPSEIIIPALIKAVYRSVATLAVITLQDVLGQGESARMNVPNKPDGNWDYQTDPNALTDDRAGWIHHLASLYGRVPEEMAQEPESKEQ